MSDRLRSLTAEHRRESTSEARRKNVLGQIGLFQNRLRFTLSAHVLLFFATALFIGTVILTILRRIDSIIVSFFIGVTLLLIAVVFEILELRLARRTVELEVADILKAADAS